MKQKSKIFRLFVPITRVDETERIVEGYAFVNETVPGDPLNLKRSAMEAATEGYMRWGAVREMHTTKAAGTANNGVDALGVEWDDRGAFFRCKVVDDDAWKKCMERVYKGFSVGVRPTVVRGRNVEACLWAETSLVDRPLDVDAEFTAIRIERIDDDPDTEMEVEEDRGLTSDDVPVRENLEGKSKKKKKDADGNDTDEDEDDEPCATDRVDAFVAAAVNRGAFADLATKSEKSRLRSAAFDWLNNCLYQWDMQSPADPVSYTREAIAEFQAFWFARGLHVFEKDEWRCASADLERAFTIPEPTVDVDKAAEILKRALMLEGENAELLKRAETAEGNLTTELERADKLQVRVAELEKMPIRVRPIKFAGRAVERTIGEYANAETEIAKLQEELNVTVKRGAESIDIAEKTRCVQRVGEIKQELAGYGVNA